MERHKKYIRVLFIVFSPQMWKSLKALYETMLLSDDIQPIIIVVDYEIKWGNRKIESSYQYWRELYPNAEIYSTEKNKPDLMTIKADYIFRQTPYDGRYPKDYSNKMCSSISTLCYIPYNYNFSLEKHLRIEYSDAFLRDVDLIFSDSDYIVSYCERKHTKEKIGTFEVYNVGSTVLDRYQLDERISDDSKNDYSFLWIPRWSIDDHNNHGTSFFKYYNNLIAYFNEHKELKLLIRPHPFMFEQFVQNGIMKENDVQIIIENIEKIKNVNLDYEMDCYDSFRKSNCLIADYSSLIVDYFFTGKPIILCDSKCDWNDEPLIGHISENLYAGYEWNSLEEMINNLCRGKDVLRDSRVAIINGYKHECINPIEKIISILRNNNGKG